tara:strand:+ start:4866 stop:7340 length:2475 start_codon:yes stop_codon:yes gene_type:complete
MDEKIKYLFFAFLGVIFYLIFLKKELVEGFNEDDPQSYYIKIGENDAVMCEKRVFTEFNDSSMPSGTDWGVVSNPDEIRPFSDLRVVPEALQQSRKIYADDDDFLYSTTVMLKVYNIPTKSSSDDTVQYRSGYIIISKESGGGYNNSRAAEYYYIPEMSLLQQINGNREGIEINTTKYNVCVPTGTTVLSQPGCPCDLSGTADECSQMGEGYFMLDSSVSTNISISPCNLDQGEYLNYDGNCITNSSFELMGSETPSLSQPDTNGEQAFGYDKRNNKCSINRNDNCDGDSGGWEENDIKRNYKSRGVRSSLDTYERNSCRKVDQLCFNTSGTTTIDNCRKKCNAFPGCRSFSFYPDPNSGESVNTSSCCLYKTGYKGYDQSDQQDETFNCYTKSDCEDGDVDEKYYSFKQCQYDVSDTDSSICGRGSDDTGNNYFTFNDSSTPNCSSQGPIKDCSDSEVNDYNYCNCNDARNICLKSECNTETSTPTCLGSETRSNSFCTYGTNENGSSTQDTNIIDDQCSCGLKNPEINSHYVSEEERVENNLPCISTDQESKYCSFINYECNTLSDCNSSGELLTESCGYDDDDGIKQMCKYTDESGLRNTMYNTNFPEKCKTINNCEYSQMNRELNDNEFCLCPIDTQSFNLCSSGQKCSASGCLTETINCPINYTLTDTNECMPSSCNYYSLTNSDPINASCICESDRQDNFVCSPGNYCFPEDNEFAGCRTSDYLKSECSQYSSTNKDPIAEECFCGRNSNGEPLVCRVGKYCVDNICKDISCQDSDHIIDPIDHTKCVSKDILDKRDGESEIEKLIDKIKDFIDNLIN